MFVIIIFAINALFIFSYQYTKSENYKLSENSHMLIISIHSNNSHVYIMIYHYFILYIFITSFFFNLQLMQGWKRWDFFLFITKAKKKVHIHVIFMFMIAACLYYTIILLLCFNSFLDVLV